MKAMERQEVFNRISRQIQDIYGIKAINGATTINSFNAVSEENDEFFGRFEKEFNVDMTGFNYHEFFNEDQFYLCAFVSLFLKPLSKDSKKKLLTIDHLVDIALLGKWSTPSINSLTTKHPVSTE